MKKIVKIFFLIIYYALASKLPNYSYPGGCFYNWVRVFCLKRIIVIGNECRIMRNVYIGNGNEIIIGDNCRINENVRLDNIEMGNHVMVARDSVLLGKSHNYKELEIPMENQGNAVTEKIFINDDVWLGLRSIIMPGIKIEKGTIIGAGAVVTKNTELNGIYGGVPAKLIRHRT